jgi:hypothetical protein
VTGPEVVRHCKEINKGWPAAPDKIKIDQLRKWLCDGKRLAAKYSCWLKTGKIPPRLKQSRSILLPKKQDPTLLRELSHWRPLTIGNHILELFARILNDRLSKAVLIHIRQRGFLRGVSASTRTWLFSKSARQREKSTGSYVRWLQQSFRHCQQRLPLGRPKVSRCHQGLCTSDPRPYRGSETSFKTARGRTRPINILRGVKQGCPLSIILFSIAVDPLICSLEELNRGKEINNEGQKVTCLSFAEHDEWTHDACDLKEMKTLQDNTKYQLPSPAGDVKKQAKKSRERAEKLRIREEQEEAELTEASCGISLKFT